MSDELFEVAFSGQVSDIAELDNVKARVGKIFNTDAAKVVQLFSGKRVVIKKNIDRLTAEKYQHALTKAGAIAEVKLMVVEGSVDTATQPVMTKVALQPNQHTTLKIDQSSALSPEEADLLPPQINPLGITGDQIPDLVATIAPLGSAMQSPSAAVIAPRYDLSGLDVAPVGSQIGSTKKGVDLPLPDTSSLSLIN
ncbi:MAG: hypothetical protein ACI9CO_000387 [Candidatus Azotimanducaceae bacterium]|jgi:hypothetical protein